MRSLPSVVGVFTRKVSCAASKANAEGPIPEEAEAPKLRMRPAAEPVLSTVWLGFGAGTVSNPTGAGASTLMSVSSSPKSMSKIADSW